MDNKSESLLIVRVSLQGTKEMSSLSLEFKINFLLFYIKFFIHLPEISLLLFIATTASVQILRAIYHGSIDLYLHVSTCVRVGRTLNNFTYTVLLEQAPAGNL